MHIFLSFVLPLALVILLIKYFFLPMFKRDDFFAAKGELKKISIDTPLLKRLGMNMEDYYYDAEFLYQKRKEDILNTISLGQIIQVRSTGTMISNRRVWQVRYLTGASRTEKTVSILHNYSVFRRFSFSRSGSQS